jgi:hypothetical protein
MKIRELGLDEGITLQCEACRSTVRWSNADPERVLGPRADLHHIGQHERLRCRGYGRAPSNAWPSWQPR